MKDPRDRTYVTEAACRTSDPSIFFPTRGGNEESKIALAICAQCPVRTECIIDRIYMVTPSMEEGVFGGMLPKQRVRLARACQPQRGVHGRPSEFEKVWDMVAAAVGEPHKIGAESKPRALA